VVCMQGIGVHFVLDSWFGFMKVLVEFWLWGIALSSGGEVFSEFLGCCC
jgi:hypothetical protein